MEIAVKCSLLSQTPLFAGLAKPELEFLASATLLRSAPRFQFIFMPGEEADQLFISVTGRIKIGAYSHDGREVIKEILQPGLIFGDGILSNEHYRTEFAQALHDDVKYFAIPVKTIRELMQKDRRLLFSCLQHISNRLQKVEERLAKLVLKDARERIIEFLVESAGREGRKVGYETLVKHYLTQQEIANITGTSRQTVTSVFNDLRKSNLIYFNRNSVLIRDIEKLA